MIAAQFIGVGGLVAGLVAGLLPLYALAYLLYVVLGLPLRRQERARLFLDLIETGVNQGRSVENTIISLSRSHDPAVGVRFHLLAAYLESGWSLVPALRKVGSLVPPQMVAVLKVGEELGDLRRVLPACRTLLRDGSSHVQSAYNYLVVLAFVVLPVVPALFWLMAVFILPKYQAIFADLMEGQPLPVHSFSVATALSQIQIVLSLFFYLGALLYIGGPRMIAWLGAGYFSPRLDVIACWVPWRRKRMHRDFAAMLALLLDAEVPEERAVLLAAESTGNSAFRGRAERMVGKLREGVTLPESLSVLDDDGELRWRLNNAFHSGKNFFAALGGWLDALDARAFRQQQAFAQLITTGLVLYNGTMVSLFAIFIFRGFTTLIEEGVLW